MGGMIAQLLALAVPERLTALVLMDTTYADGRGHRARPRRAGRRGRPDRGLDRLFELLNEHDSPLTTEADRRVRAEREGYIAFGDRKLLACSPAMYAAMCRRAPGASDRLDALATLPMPTLVIVGEQDTPFLAPSRAMADAIPGAELVVVPDAGHSPQFEAPERWWDAVSGFLDRVHSPAPPGGR